MSKYRYEMGGVIRDTEIDFPYYTDEIIELLDEKDKKIADLEAKLTEKEKERLDIWKDYKYYKNRCLRLENKRGDEK